MKELFISTTIIAGVVGTFVVKGLQNAYVG